MVQAPRKVSSQRWTGARRQWQERQVACRTNGPVELCCGKQHVAVARRSAGPVAGGAVAGRSGCRVHGPLVRGRWTRARDRHKCTAHMTELPATHGGREPGCGGRTDDPRPPVCCRRKIDRQPAWHWPGRDTAAIKSSPPSASSGRGEPASQISPASHTSNT